MDFAFNKNSKALIIVSICALMTALAWLFRPAFRGELSSGRSQPEALRALDAELKKQSAEDRFSGTVLVAKDGKPIFQSAYGYADRDQKILNTIETKFRFGSMGKMFTAVATLQLVQAGKLRLDDPIRKHLPNYPNENLAKKATIHHLLTHTGGTGDIFGPEFRGRGLRDLNDYIAATADRGLEFEPGSKHKYSNFGFVLLGRIIEVASGQTYYDYVRDHIFEPAGMTSTGNNPEEQHEPNLSIGYTTMPPPRLLPPPSKGQTSPPPRLLPPPGGGPRGPLRSNVDELPYRGTPAGGGYSTVGDFLKFANALNSHKLLDEPHTELLTSGKVYSPAGKYAYGFEDQLIQNGARRIGHGGGFAGMNAILSIFPASNYVVVVLANMDPPTATEIDQFIASRLPLDKPN